MTMRKRCLPPGWYPDTANACKSDIEEFVAGFAPPEGTWRGGVAPHAGWFFSGRAAARVIRTLATTPRVDRVVVYGGHLPGGSEPVVYAEDSWETPLGAQPLDSSFARELASAGEAEVASRSFSDNTVEIQLPFVRHFFADAQVIAVHSPSSDRAVRLASAIHRMLAEANVSAVYLGSADLTHYGPNYGFSPKGTGADAVAWVKNENDRSLIEKAVALNASGVLEDARLRYNTCSAGPIASVMTSVSKHGVEKGRLLEYYTSHDVMPNSSFVGYAAIVY
jgi:AmmeMemoRadiSam system protein B